MIVVREIRNTVAIKNTDCTIRAYCMNVLNSPVIFLQIGVWVRPPSIIVVHAPPLESPARKKGCGYDTRAVLLIRGSRHVPLHIFTLTFSQTFGISGQLSRSMWVWVLLLASLTFTATLQQELSKSILFSYM